MRHYKRYQAYPMPPRRWDLMVMLLAILVSLALVALEVPGWLN